MNERVSKAITMNQMIQLFPPDVMLSVPALYSAEKEDDPQVVCKFFALLTHWSWFVLDGSPVDEDGEVIQPGENKTPCDYLFFGLVHGDYEELGYFHLSELLSLRLGGIVPLVQRDEYFESCLLSQVRTR